MTVILSFTACNSEYDKYMTEVKTGYLGGCLDATVDEVFSQSMPNGKWDGGETDSGKMIVEYQGELSGSEVRIQFTVENENQFKVSSIKGDNVQPQNAAEAAAIIESRYVQYYSYKYPSKAAADMMPNEPTENLLNGISAAYAEKAKNPIDIANYLDKTQNEIQTAFNLKDDGAGTFSNSEISLMYGDSKVDNVTVKGSRIYSLFGLQTYQSIDTVSGKIGDRFEKISEEEKQDGTKSVAFIRNNSEDSLIVTYSAATSCVTELTYISNGMAGYRAEQERLKKEAEEKAAAEAAAKAKAEATARKTSWKTITGSSFTCSDCQGDIFIGITTEDMQPYIEGTANGGMFSIYGSLAIISNSKLHYSGDEGSFDIIIKDENTIVIETNSLRAFAGTYKKYSWIQAG